ncbi:Uncharacterized oxidoreductase SAV2478 [Delftia tsuruhatensis]|uniref:SDR family NAD(P)-dependent oxidoreductase n=1 Tax=Delftia tsuruhatensis TaxID=180282 RepID=UPI001E78BE04|nr:SDR family NAD(P)-dependent oxidoreductase [Delftia tsuruhatensis]CAB5701144.1 Uncharacterized oxidoreductase SAV2478 [Delftia tsuruhatensis]CAC9693393.1 Uncharacterized oxidoreductase SAV2478 [Delftia tsuruhatensis]
MSIRKKIVIVGATSLIAQHCARLWLREAAVDLVLVGRDEERIGVVADDLRVRNPGCNISVKILADFMDVSEIGGLAQQVADQRRVDILLIAHGSLPVQSECQEYLDICRSALETNGLSPVLFAEAFAKQMEKQNHGTIALIGSVAGDRGRRSNYVYGAAKGMIDRYAQGLRHRFAGKALKVVLVKPGPTDTPMTASMKDRGARLAPVENVAKEIVDGIYRGNSIIYSPRKWRVIMWIIVRIPDVIFKKLNI